MKSIVTTLLVILANVTLIAQSHSYYTHKLGLDSLIAKKELCVILAPLDNEYIQSQEAKGKTELVNAYASYIEKLNTNVKKVFIEDWKLHKKVTFETFENVLRLSDEEKRSKAFVIIYPENKLDVFDEYYHTVLFQDYDEKTVKNFKKLFRKPKEGPKGYFVFKFICRYNYEVKKTKSDAEFVFRKCISGLETRKYELELLVNSTQSYLSYVLEGNKVDVRSYIKSSVNIIDRKVLYILDEMEGKKLDIDEIRSIYPYEVKFVTSDEYKQAVEEKDPNVAVLVVEPIQQMIKYSASYNTPQGLVFGHYIYSTDKFKMIGGQIPIITPYKYSANYNLNKKRVKKYTNWK